jgi:RNA polymerase sigma-70 factor (ECF subfamily)
MSAESSFEDLMARVRAGDDAAAAELVRRYEPAIRRAVRIWLVDARLERLFDSADICQSVLASFFVRAALDQYDLSQPAQLQKLLATMARNKLAEQVHKQQAQRRDHRRWAGAAAGPEIAAPGASPSRQVAARELLDEAHRRLSAEERQLLEWRQDGREWADIAAEVGGSAEALRKKLARAVERVAQELGLEEVDHG